MRLTIAVLSRSSLILFELPIITIRNSQYIFFLDKQCQYVFNGRHFFTGISYHLTQYYGLLIKTVRVRYRRWALILVILLIPILYNLLSNLISREGSNSGTFEMNLNSLNPQTIFYHTDPTIEQHFRASIDAGAKLEQGSIDISEMNQHIWRKFLFDNTTPFYIVYYS